MGGISAALVVFSGTKEEEEVNLGEVSDGNFLWGGSLGVGVQGLYNANREGRHSRWRIIFLLIGQHLEPEMKTKSSHAVMAGVVSPHRCKDFTNGAEVLLNRSLLDEFPLRR